MHHDPAIWGQDVESFNPDRWLQDGKFVDRKQDFLPFSIGRQNNSLNSHTFLYNIQRSWIASEQLSASAHWLWTHRQIPRTDKDYSLLNVALGKADPLISARQRYDIDLWPWPWPLTLTLKQVNSEVKTQFLAFDLDLWPTTSTYNPNLAKVKVDLHTKNRGRWSNGSAGRVLTNTRTDGRTLPSALSPRFAFNNYDGPRWNWGGMELFNFVDGPLSIMLQSNINRAQLQLGFLDI